MHKELSEEWLRQPPEILVVGRGAYAGTFAQILGVSLTLPGILLPTAQDSSHGDEMLVFSRLRSVFLIEPPLSPALRWGGCGREEKGNPYQ